MVERSGGYGMHLRHWTRRELWWVFGHFALINSQVCLFHRETVHTFVRQPRPRALSSAWNHKHSCPLFRICCPQAHFICFFNRDKIELHIRSIHQNKIEQTILNN